jgi:hypothetical protein
VTGCRKVTLAPRFWKKVGGWRAEGGRGDEGEEARAGEAEGQVGVREVVMQGWKEEERGR